MGLKAVCLVKQTFATEAKVALDGAGAISRDRVKEVINPYDEFALEEAALWREAGHVDDVTLVCVGEEKAVMESLRKALAMAGDQAVLIDTTGTDPAAVDESVVARAITAVLRNRAFDVVFCGKVAVDSNAMEVPGRVAAALDIPLVANVSSVTCGGRTLVAERSGDGVREVVEADLPAMVSADKSLNKPRYPNLPSIMKAKKKPVEVIPIATALGAAPAASRRVVAIQLPEAKGPCRFLEGPPQQAAAELARILRDEVGVLH